MLSFRWPIFISVINDTSAFACPAGCCGMVNGISAFACSASYYSSWQNGTSAVIYRTSCCRCSGCTSAILVNHM